MELEHRFEVPVGIDKAWASLLDMEMVGPCFPGASLDTVNGDEFTGSVKIKLGPVRMTYKGSARIVDKDPVAHRARIEATGNAGGSTSTAAMMVTASATAVAPNRTAVDLVTTLSLTGRPAQFGRGVMVDVGNKLIGQFADCVSNKLSGRPAGGVELVDVLNPDVVAADYVAPPVDQAAVPAAAALSSGVHSPAGSGTRSESPKSPESPEPPNELNLLSTTATPILKRVLPIVLGVVSLLLARKLFRRDRDDNDNDNDNDNGIGDGNRDGDRDGENADLAVDPTADETD